MSVLVALSTTLVVLACGGLGVIAASFEAQSFYATHAAIRTPALLADERATVRAIPLYTHAGGRTIHVIASEPLTADVTPPLGLGRWPAPGEFLISADLEPDAQALSARFGDLAGVIDDAWLPSAQSRTVFVRPDHALPADAEASGFGVSGPLQAVAAEASGFNPTSQIPLPVALGGAGIALVLPAILVLSAVLARVRAQRSGLARTLEILGVPPGVLHRRAIRGLLPPLALGLLTAVVVACVALVVDIPLPLADYTIRSIDLRRSLGLIAEALALGGAVAAMVLIAMSRPRSLAQANRPRPAGTSRWRPLMAAACVVVIVGSSQLAMDATATALASGSDASGILWLMGGILLGVATLPALIGELVDRLGHFLAEAGRRQGRGTAILVGRSLVASRGAVRIATAGAVLIVVSSGAATWALAGSLPALAAQQTLNRVDGRFVEITGPQENLETAPQILAGLPPDIAHLTIDSVMTPTSTDTTQNAASFTQKLTVYGEPDSLEHWDLRAGQSLPVGELPNDLDAAMPAEPAVTVAVHQGPAPDRLPDVGAGAAYRFHVAFNTAGARVERDEIQRALTQAGGLDWSVRLGGEHWVIGANDLAHALRWVVWFAVLGGLVMLLSVWARTAADLTGQAQTITPIDTLFSARAKAPRVLAARMLLLTGTATIIGAGAGAMFSRMSSGALTTTGGAPAIVALVAILCAAAMAALSTPLVLRLRPDNHPWTGGRFRDSHRD